MHQTRITFHSFLTKTGQNNEKTIEKIQRQRQRDKYQVGTAFERESGRDKMQKRKETEKARVGGVQFQTPRKSKLSDKRLKQHLDSGFC